MKEEKWFLNIWNSMQKARDILKGCHKPELEKEMFHFGVMSGLDKDGVLSWITFLKKGICVCNF